MFKPLLAVSALAFSSWILAPAEAAPRSTEVSAQAPQLDVSARKKRAVRRHRVRGYPRYRVTEYYAPRPFRYYYGPGYRLYWGSPHYYGPQGLMWPYTSGPYPDVTFGFGAW